MNESGAPPPASCSSSSASPPPPPPDLRDALGHLVAASAAARGNAAAFAPFVPPEGGLLRGEFEVRAADGRVRRMQPAALPLPAPLLRAFEQAAPAVNFAIDLGSHRLTLWAPAELIELQVGYRWHGFNGKRMREWDERYVVFAEDGGDPMALRLDEPDGPVWLARRGEGRHAFFAAAPSLAHFYEALALWMDAAGDAKRLAGSLEDRFGAAAAPGLWLWRELVSRVDSRR